jgi:acetoin utilization protein AcuB
MLVKDIMQHDVACVRPETRLDDVLRLLQRRGIRHVPVLHHESLAGIISDRDLKAVLPRLIAEPARPENRPLTAGDIMTKRVVTVEPTTSVEDAARLIVHKRIGALPVVEGRTLVGIVTETDVLMLFVRAMGILEPSSRLDVLLPDAPASLGRALHVIEGAGAGVSSVVTLLDPSLKVREAIIRIATIDPGPAMAALEAGGFAVRNPKRPVR